MVRSYREENRIHQMLKESTESVGVKFPVKSPLSEDNKRSNAATTSKGNTRYKVRLLWKNDNNHLPDSFNIASKHLLCLELLYSNQLYKTTKVAHSLRRNR